MSMFQTKEEAIPFCFGMDANFGLVHHASHAINQDVADTSVQDGFFLADSDILPPINGGKVDSADDVR